MESPAYRSLLSVYNAKAGSNESTNGTYSFTVENSFQDLLPDFSNTVDLTYLIDSKSQASSLTFRISEQAMAAVSSALHITGSDCSYSAL